MLEQTFLYPEWLWLLPALIPVAIWDGWRRWETSRKGKVLGVTVRMLMLTALVLALASPVMRTEREQATVIFIVDRSESIPDAELARARQHIEALQGGLNEDDKVALMVFDAGPEVLVGTHESWSLPASLRGAEAVASTQLESALSLGLAMIPVGGPGRIVLWTDGQTTDGDAERVFADARARGVPIDVVPLEPDASSVAVRDVVVDAVEVRPGETITGSVEVDGGESGARGTVELKLGGETLTSVPVEVPAGERRRATFSHALNAELEAGLKEVEAVFVPESGTVDPELARGWTGVLVAEPPQVLMIYDDRKDVTSLAKALEAEGMVSELVDYRKMGEQGPSLEDTDLVVLANVPAQLHELGTPGLTEPFIAELRRFVSAGGGLITLGGDSAYELGGYQETELAAILPLKLEPTDQEINGAVTLIIILDRSGSMGQNTASGRTKMQLANDGAVASMHLLRDIDQIGVMAVDSRVHWEVEVQELDDRPRLENKIRWIYAGGGGIYVYTSLKAAYEALEDADTPLRHIILFSDADDSEEQFSYYGRNGSLPDNCYDLAELMKDEGITLSVIGIGTEFDKDHDFLQQLAKRGDGRFYITNKAEELRGLFVEETEQVVKKVLHEEPFQVVMKGEHPALEGLELETAPPLEGYVEVKAKDTGEVVLESPVGHPVMVTWRYGLGQVASLSTDAGARWAKRWLRWPGYPRLWTQMARWALRHREGDDTGVAVDFSGDRAHISVARRSDSGLSESDVAISAALIERSPDGKTRETPLELDALEPGLWSAERAVQPGHTYQVQVRDGEGKTVAERSFVSPSSPEQGERKADRERLQAWAQGVEGRFAERLDAVAPLERERFEDLHELWLYFALLGLLLLPFDAMLRRPAREI